MGKFRQLSPELWPLIDVKKLSQELWPLIDVKNLFPLSILSIFLTDFLHTLCKS